MMVAENGITNCFCVWMIGMQNSLNEIVTVLLLLGLSFRYGVPYLCIYLFNFSIGIQGPRCVLAGDHLQLPPTIQSVEAEKKGMGKTLFERLTEGYGEEITSMLTVQYRMHELIMNWSSKELYNNKVHFPSYYHATC
jgi:hypothetical protein